MKKKKRKAVQVVAVMMKLKTNFRKSYYQNRPSVMRIREPKQSYQI